MAGGYGVWMTVATDDVMAMQALVLGRSLKRTLTSHRVAVVVSKPTSDKMRAFLASEFDQVLDLEKLALETTAMNGLPQAFYCKLLCWGLPLVDRVIFLSPEHFILSNADELFEMMGDNIAFGDKGIVQVIKPDLDTFHEIITAVRNGEIHSGLLSKAEWELSAWLQKQNILTICKDKRYCTPITSETNNDRATILLDGVSICHFVNLQPLKEGVLEGYGIVEKGLAQLWLKMWHELQSDISKTELSTQNVDFCKFPDKEPIAIVGISCRLPGANNVDEYWDVLINGRDCIQKVPDHRWPSEKTPEFREVQAGFLKCPVDSFDGKFFGISPADLMHTDPQQRLLMEVVWEALEDASINPQELKGTQTGVFVGSWTSDYRDLINDASHNKIDTELTEFHRMYMGNSLGGTGGRLAFLLGLTGPNVATESGCSSGMVAIYLATESLRAGRCKVAIAGGVNLLLHPFKRKHMQSIIASDGRCKTFDEKADGFGRGEGVASFILKKYSDAVKDGDKIHGLIRGAAIAQEGTSRSFGTPTKECEEIAMTNALRDAGLNAKDVGVVEAHGTGTIVGDPVEVAAITSVYSKDRTTPLILASGKTNIGHTESCSGFAGIIKVVLSMKHGVIPPHLNLDKVNPHINFEAIPAVVPLDAMEWKRDNAKPRIAGVSSYGITGTDAHIIIQEPPEENPGGRKPLIDFEMERPLHLITFSSKHDQGLDDVLTQYSSFLGESELLLADLAFTANTGRAHFPYRAAVIAKDAAEACKKVKSCLQNQKKSIPEHLPKVCFLFTGQGSQYPNMAKSLYDTNAVFRMHFDQCLKVLKTRFGLDLKPVLWPNGKSENGELKQSLFSQASIFCVEYALSQLWLSWGLKPDMVVGHSLGEFAAAVCAGLLSLQDALTLIAERSRLINAQRTGGMLAVKADKAKTSKLKDEFLSEKETTTRWLDFAAVNSSDQTVVAGPLEVVTQFSEFLKNKGIKSIVLEATHAFHSRDMEPMLAEYKSVASKMAFGKPSSEIKYISGVTGKLLENMDADYWVRHTREAVQFKDASMTAWREEGRVFLEVGPQPVLTALTMANVSDLGEEVLFIPSLRKTETEWTTLLTAMTKLYVAGFNFDFKAFDQYYPRKKVSLPFYPFNRKVFWYDQGKERSSSSNGALSFNSANVLHPLIGHAIPNATSIKLFQGAVNPERFAYLKDHKIGEAVIFPGAGYLEMCLAAGNASTSIQVEGERVQMPANPVAINDLAIHAPLALEGSVHLQTTVDTSDSQMQLAIFALNQGKWVKQATASFSPLPMTFAPDDGLVSKDSLSTILDRMEPADVDIFNFYDKLSEVGLNFGPIFRSITNVLKGSERELLCELQIPEHCSEYLVHPVILDALIQSIMVGIGCKMNSLFVPISVGKLVVFHPLTENIEKLYAHCHWDNESPDARCSVLYDDTGRLIAYMTGVQMIETSVLQILKALNNQKLSLPGMYEEVWRPKTGMWKNRTNMSSMVQDYLLSEEYSNKILELNQLTEKEFLCKKLREEIVFFYMLNAFYEMGWSQPPLQSCFSLMALMNRLGVVKGQKKFFTHLLSIFEEEKLLSRDGKSGSNSWTVIAEFPNQEAAQKRVLEIQTELSEGSPPTLPHDVKVMSVCGEQLSKFFQGKASPLSILFPDDPNSEVSADVFYTTTPLGGYGYQTMGMVFQDHFTNWRVLPEEERGVLRVLEVGAGTGSSTKTMLDALEKQGVKYQYTFSDVSPAFFIKARQMFDSKKIIYKVFNIEEDPLCQGFVPSSFDIILGSNVIHATKNLRETLSNLRNLLRDSGLFFMVETFQPSRDVDLVFGGLENFWRYGDIDIRPFHPFINADKWCELFQSAGFGKVQKFYSYDFMNGGIVGKVCDTETMLYKPQERGQEKTWLIYETDETFLKEMGSHFHDTGRKPLVVYPWHEFQYDEDNLLVKIRPLVKEDSTRLFQELRNTNRTIEGILYAWGDLAEANNNNDPCDIAFPFLFLAQTLVTELQSDVKLIVLTEGVIPVGDQSATKLGQSVLWGMARVLRSENSNIFTRCVDLDPDEKDWKEVFAEMWLDDLELQVALRNGSRHVCRLTTNKGITQALSLPQSERFSLVLPKTRNINDLTFCANGRQVLTQGQIEVQVKCMGLNFRDVFVVLKPDKAFDNFNVVGLEFSGVVISVGDKVSKVKIGDKVIGCNMRGDALPSHITVSESDVIPMPEGLTFHEACTFPAAFATVYYCLIILADLKKGETVLIHAGSGGVGLFAIQVAKAIGAEIITTAGSRRKRAYLRSLGVQHVFHSRNTYFGGQIMEVTKGKGVHVVLNCLTSPGFKEASLGVCNKGARFVEISKMAIWTEEEVKEMRPDVKYTAVDLTTVTGKEWDGLWDGLKSYVKKGFLKPIPFVRYDVQNIREALLYMQKAKHIGKILVTMPEPRPGGQGDPKTNIFHDNCTYLITGGLGGLGLEVAKWMTESGAQNIVLASRREPNERAQKLISEMTGKGNNIVVKLLDVGSYEDCKNLLTRIQNGEEGLPPLRGIMHAAGSLSDATYINQTEETYKIAFRGKVQGAWNLHQLTTELDCHLEHFILYSSIVAIFGPVGLSNYAAANTFLDALAHYRNAVGLTAQSINWGQWGEIGAAANINITALRAFTPSQGVAALQAIMKTLQPQAVVVDADFSVLKKICGNGAAYLEEMKITNQSQNVTFNVKMDRFWDEYNSAVDDEKRAGVLKSYVEIILRQILKFDDDEVIDENQNFSEMGMDSLMMLEMKNQMQTMLGKGVTMNVSAMQELTTVHKIVIYLQDTISQMGQEDGEIHLDFDTFSDNLVALINKDMALPDHLVKFTEGLQYAVKRSEIKVILLTGVTGKFGPFLLRSILMRKDIQRVLCLVRSTAKESPEQRLSATLENLGLMKDIDMTKVEVLEGDVKAQYFGLSESQWDLLVDSVDAVVHCAVKANLMDPYARFTKDGALSSVGKDIRSVNVLGTINVLELCVSGKRMKPFFFASTLLANQVVNPEDLTMFEDWYSPEDVFALKNTGYPVSKFICEVLLKQMSDLGLPTSVFRLPSLFGDSTTGCFTLNNNNHAVVRLLGFCKLGVMPGIPLPIQVLPSDTAADLCLEAWWNDDAPLGIYNVTNPHVAYFHDIPKVTAELGFPIKLVEWETFSKILSEKEEIQGLFPNSEVDLEEGRFIDFATSPKALKTWIQNPDKFFPSKRMQALFPDLETRIEHQLATLKRGLEFAIDSGVFAKFGLKKIV